MDLSIIIVNYNSGRDLDCCLDALAVAAVPGRHEVIVVDNASHDGSEVIAIQPHLDVAMHRNMTNIGFGAGVNLGVSLAKGRYLLILNPDVRVHRDSIATLMRYLDVHPDAGLCAPKLLNEDGSLQYSCRTFPSVGTIIFRRTVLNRWFPDAKIVRRHLMTDWDHRTTREVDWVLGAAMLLRREAFVTSTVIDERFFLYFEDVDLCRRLSLAGWRVVYHPEGVMTHSHHRASARGWMTRSRFEHLWSWVKYEWKYRVAPYFGGNAVGGLVPRMSRGLHA